MTARRHDAAAAIPPHDAARAWAQGAVEELLADPNGNLTPLRGNRLWQIALLELWFQSHGITGPAA